MDNKFNSRRFKSLILEYLKNDDIHSLNTLIEANASKVYTPLLSLSYLNDEDLNLKVLNSFTYTSKILCKEDKEAVRKFVRRLIWMLTEESGGIPWLAPAIIGAVISSDISLAKEYFHILISYVYENENEPENYLDHPPLRANVYLGILQVLHKFPDLINSNEIVLKERIRLETDAKIIDYLKEIQKYFNS